MYLYLHVPFCARRCSYCDFAIAVRRETPDQEYLDAIRVDWEARRSVPAWEASPEIATIYFGGGTPSRLRGETLSEIIAMLRRDRAVAADAEITIEVNPDDVTRERAERWRTAGINRISLGVQSHDAGVLEWMHRTHTAEQVPAAIAALRQAGFANISMDLIFGLPVSLDRDLTRDLERTFALEPTHLSLYGLTIEPHTPLARWTNRGEATAIPDERYATEYLEVHQALVAHGFEHYEVSNAGLPGFRAQHNSAYWRAVDYVGLGPSAHSLLAGVRSWNVREWAEFSRLAQAGERLEAGSEALDPAARRLEELYLGLRTSDGLAEGNLPATARDAWISAGWATRSDGRVRLTAEGWLRLDALVTAIADS